MEAPSAAETEHDATSLGIHNGARSINVLEMVADFPSAAVTNGITSMDTFFALVTPNASDAERQRYIAFTVESKRAVLPGLERAIDVVRAIVPEFDFFQRLLPRLCATMRSLPTLFPDPNLPILTKGVSRQVTLTRPQVFGLLVASFFQRLTSMEGPTFGALRWMDIIVKSWPVAVHRVACLLTYFHTYLFASYPLPDADSGDAYSVTKLLEPQAASDAIVFERVSSPGPISMEALLAMEDTLVAPKYEKPVVVVSSTARIEDVASADAIVDFANKQVRIGCIIASATQEEVLFSIKPEAFLAVVLFEELDDHEAGLIHNAQRYCSYTGYGETFRFKGTFDPSSDGDGSPATIVIVDALVNVGQKQFEDDGFARDVWKAYIAFQRLRKVRTPFDTSEEASMPVVSTGGWGCGIFRGDQTLKFLQQLIAASMAKCKVVYTTFGAHDRAKSFEAIAHRLIARKTTVAEVARWAKEFAASDSLNDEELTAPKDFEFFVLTKLR